MSETLGCGHPDKNRACGDCLDEAEAQVKRLELQSSEERERCAKIAESEPWPEGPAPAEVLAASAGLRYEQIVEAAVKATRESIAQKIRKPTEQRNDRDCSVCGWNGSRDEAGYMSWSRSMHQNSHGKPVCSHCQR